MARVHGAEMKRRSSHELSGLTARAARPFGGLQLLSYTSPARSESARAREGRLEVLLKWADR